MSIDAHQRRQLEAATEEIGKIRTVEDLERTLKILERQEAIYDRNKQSIKTALDDGSRLYERLLSKIAATHSSARQFINQRDGVFSKYERTVSRLAPDDERGRKAALTQRDNDLRRLEERVEKKFGAHVKHSQFETLIGYNRKFTGAEKSILQNLAEHATVAKRAVRKASELNDRILGNAQKIQQRYAAFTGLSRVRVDGQELTGNLRRAAEKTAENIQAFVVELEQDRNQIDQVERHLNGLLAIKAHGNHGTVADGLDTLSLLGVSAAVTVALLSGGGAVTGAVSGALLAAAAVSKLASTLVAYVNQIKKRFRS